MKYITLFLLFISAQVCQLNAQTTMDVLHYQFEVRLSDQNDSIQCKATIKIKFLAAADNFNLDLVSNQTSSGKGMLVTSILEGDREMRMEQSKEKVTIHPSTSIKAEETRSYTVSYRGIPADGLIISRTKYGERSFFADNWPNRGHNWLPCVDLPGDKATVDFIVTAPQHYQVVSNGVMIEETNLTDDYKLTHWREDVPIATKVMVIGAANFAVNLAGTIDNCVPVYSWVYPQDRDKGFYDYALAMDILPFFIKNVGPYGYKKLANVQSKTTFGGLENANTIFYAESSVVGNRSSETLIAHEIAHQWFGNMATEKTFAHLWLSEGFATFMTVWYMETKHGQDTARKMLLQDRRDVIAFAKNSQRTVVDNSTNYMDLLNVNSYQKGGWVLHMLRRQLGDSIFTKAIKGYYAKYAGGNADTKDLQQVFELASKKKLETFFSDWLYSPGIPVVDIEWSWYEKDKKLSITTKQSQSHIFQFPLEIAINTGTGKPVIEKLQVTKATQSFTIPVKGTVQDIVADPNVSLLFDGKVIKK